MLAMDAVVHEGDSIQVEKSTLVVFDEVLANPRFKT